jgi:hypothetical protein
MSQTCTVCRHEQRELIDRALVAGTPLRDIAERFFSSKAALARHRVSHLLPEVLQAATVKQTLRADALIAEATALHQKARDLLRQAEEKGDMRTAMAGVREVLRCLDFALKLQTVIPAEVSHVIDVEAVEMADTPTVEAVRRDWELICVVLGEELQQWPTIAKRIVTRLEQISFVPVSERMKEAAPWWPKDNTDVGKSST